MIKLDFNNIINAAIKRHRLTNSYFDKDELRNECWLALQRAKANFNPAKGEFEKFASRWIKHELTNYINKMKFPLSYSSRDRSLFFHDIVKSKKSQRSFNNLLYLTHDSDMTQENKLYLKEISSLLSDKLGENAYSILIDKFAGFKFNDIAKRNKVTVRQARTIAEKAFYMANSLLRDHEKVYGNQINSHQGLQ